MISIAAAVGVERNYIPLLAKIRDYIGHLDPVEARGQ